MGPKSSKSLATKCLSQTFPRASTGLGEYVQQVVDLVSTGLSHANSMSAWPATPAEGRLGYEMASPAELDPIQVRQIWSNWVLANGFRDIAELAGEALERAHLGLIRIVDTVTSANEGRTNGKAGEQGFEGDMIRFHGMGLPSKFDFLERKFGFAVPVDFRVYVQSINAVRNCLVHRNGVVGDKDLKGGQALLLEWQPLRIYAAGPEGEREVRLGEVVNEGEVISMINRRQSKKFPRGTRIGITPQEFAEVAWTIFRFGAVIDGEIEEYARERGTVVSPTESTSE